MNFDEIMKLIQAVSKSGLSSFELEEGKTKISMKNEKTISQVVSVVEKGSETNSSNSLSLSSAPINVVNSQSTPLEVTTEIGSDKVIISPLVGTFYNSSSPEAEPFVKIGDTVKKGQALGIIEAMKLMNDIDSEFDGVIEAILVENEQVVEYGQPLFRIR